MGGGNSKQAYLPYEEAVKRVTDAELKRLKDAFKRFSSVNGYMTKSVFIKEVLGEGVPAKLAEEIYSTFGGSSKGLGFKDLLCGLVMLTRGKNEEKYKFIFGVYADENLSYVHKADMDSMIAATEGQVPQALSELFRESDKVGYDLFRLWVLANADCTSVSRWLIKEPCTVTLSNDHETPTFYQTLAGVTHLEENDIIELEKRYWVLKSQSSSGKFDLDTFTSIVCPPVPKAIVNNLFLAFDENQDNHIDFKEMACGISACCRGPLMERHKFCFKVFDEDRDGKLTKSNLVTMMAAMLSVRRENKTQEELECDGLNSVTAESLAAEILQSHDPDSTGRITQAEYLMWTVKHTLPQDFLDLLFQISHIVLGLKPQSKEDEGKVVIGWLERSERASLEVGNNWYLVAMGWWQQWLDYVNYNYQPVNCMEPFNNNNTDSYKKSSLGTALCPTLGRKYSTGSIGSIGSEPQTEVQGVTYSTLQYRDQRRSQGLSGDAALTTTKYATLPRGSASVQGSPLHSRSDTTIKTSMSAQSTPTHHKSLTGSGTAITPATPLTPALPKPRPRPSQVDNTPLVVSPPPRLTSLTNEGGRLRRDKTLSRGKDFELVPEAVWKALLAWYGGSPALPRTVISPRHCPEPELELYPAYQRLLRHQPLPTRPAQAPAFTGMMGGISGMIPGTAGLSGGSSQPQPPRRYVAYTACFSRKHTIGQIYEFIANRLRISKEDIRLWIYKDEQNQTLLEEERLCVEDCSLKEDGQVLIEVRNKDLTWPEELSQLAKNKAVLDKGPTIAGVTGLSNLGNTCFMNSALQCVSNTRPLTMYFKGGLHLYELNRGNPLGMKGHVAQRYGELLKELWSGQTRSLAPLKIRWTIAKYAPRFSGFQQHDCQELLAFLLDGLHEDLNRVQVKPYVELKDSDGRADHIVAKEAWENHMQRNKSVIVDLFHGQLKSEVKCRECGNTSVRFDPFTYLSLPLPMESCLHIEIIVMRLNGTMPVKYGLRMNMDDKYKAVKHQVSELATIAVTQLLLVEVFGALVKSFPADGQKIRPVVVGNLYAYEVPPINHIPPMTASEERHSDNNNTIHGGLSPGKSKLPPDSDRASNNNRDIPSANQTPCTNSSSNHSSPNILVNGVIPNHNNQSNSSSQNNLSNQNSRNSSASSLSSVNNQNGLNKNSPESVQTTANQNHLSNGLTNGSGGHKISPSHKKGIANGNTVGVGSPSHQKGLANGSHAHEKGLANGSAGLGSPSHQRSLSNASNNSSVAASADLPYGMVVAVHRKMLRQDVYFLSCQKTRPSVFGTPLILPCDEGATHRALYSAVWDQVGRLVSPLPPQEGGSPSNHALDCDDSLGYEYPFTLRVVREDGTQCTWCPWYRFCRGCKIECDDQLFNHGSRYLAIDWEPTALHLRYQASQERLAEEHSSVSESRRRQTEPIHLDTCLQAFTREERLGDQEMWYCSRCKKHQLADKKLQIWRLPPVLIIHLKRFQFLNTRWVKSTKIVKFPFQDFDPSDYLVSRSLTELNQSESTKLENANESTNHNTQENGSVKSKPTNSRVEHIGKGNKVAPNQNSVAKTDKHAVTVNKHKANGSINNKADSDDISLEICDDSEVNGGQNGSPDSQRSSKGQIGSPSSQMSNGSVKTGSSDSSSEGHTGSPTSQRSSEEGHNQSYELEDYTDVRYDLYAMACHSGMLGGGHYVSYGKNPNNKWYCYNDSMCKEIAEQQIDTKSAYILFYERKSTNIGHFMPDIRGREPDTNDIDDECDSDIRKMCTVM